MVETTEVETVGVVATYVGKRVTQKKKLAHFWMINGELLGFKDKLAPACIGEQWLFKSLKEAPKSYFSHGPHRPTQLEPQIKDPVLVTQWTAEEAAACNRYAQEREDKRLNARKSELDEALAPLKNMVSQLRTTEEVHHFIQYVSKELWRRQP